jgi:cell division protein FtsB
MVVRRRFTRFILPVALYMSAGAMSAYFIYHAHSGNRGVDTKLALQAEIASLEAALGAVKNERLDWERRVGMFRAEAIDRDLLEERARLVLGRVHRNDVVIMQQ